MLNFNSEGVTVVKEVGEITKTRTQSIKVIVIEKEGEKFVSVQKWWRKSVDENWQEGKGFHFPTEDVEEIQSLISKALLAL